ncbi:MAG: type II secretion system F family protein [Caldisericia bacterium]|nr:type II secretion system F family protein [Caldisericia bacterium]
MKKKPSSKVIVLSASEKLQFLFQVSLMLCQRISVAKTLEILVQTQKSRKIKKVCQTILEEISHGNSIAVSVDAILQPPAFFLAIIRSGEKTGHLGTYLLKAYTFSKKQYDAKKDRRSQAFYPLFVFVSTFFLSCGIVAFAIPNMVSMAESLQLVLPGTILSLLSFFTWVEMNWGYLVFGFLLLIALFWWFLRRNRYWIDWLLLRLPFYNSYIRKKELLSLFTLLSMLLKDQIPLEKALELSLETIQKEPLRDELSFIFQQIYTGNMDLTKFASAFGKQGSFIAFLKSSVNKEQFIENTDFLISVISQEIDDSKKKVTKLIEPVSLGFIGLMVLFVITKVYLPMFEMFSSMEWMSGF